MIIVFDLDECIASLEPLAQIFYDHIRNGFALDNRFRLRFRRELKDKYLRPGIVSVFKTLYDCKIDAVEYVNTLAVDHIVLFTNASNKYGWVSYVSGMIDEIVTHNRETMPSFFDRIIYRNSPGRTIVPKEKYGLYGGIPPKCIGDVYRLLSVSTTVPLIMFDDTVCNIISSLSGKDTIHQVPQFHHKYRHKYSPKDTYDTFIKPLMLVELGTYDSSVRS